MVLAMGLYLKTLSGGSFGSSRLNPFPSGLELELNLGLRNDCQMLLNSGDKSITRPRRTSHLSNQRSSSQYQQQSDESVQLKRPRYRRRVQRVGEEGPVDFR